MTRRWVLTGVAGGVVLMGVATAVAFSPGQRATRWLQQADRLAAQGAVQEAIRVYQTVVDVAPAGAHGASAWLALGTLHEQVGDLREARATYRRALGHALPEDRAATLRERLGRVTMALLFSTQATDTDTAYEVVAGDTLSRIASRFHTTVDLLQRGNDLTGDRIYPGMRLKVARGPFQVRVDTSEHTLTLSRGEEVLRVYAVATGRSDQLTPEGSYTVVNKLEHPIWYRPGGGVIPPGDPDNLLGTRWLGLSAGGYGIHGTTDPTSVGQEVTRGCIRLRNEDVEELYAVLPIGTEVVIEQ